MTPFAQKAIVWGLVGLGAYLVLRKIMAARSIQPYASGGGAGAGAGSFGGVTASGVSPTPVGPTAQVTTPTGDPIGIGGLLMTSAVQSAPGPNGSTVYRLAPSVAPSPSSSPMFIAPTTQTVAAGGSRFAVQSGPVPGYSKGIAYDPIFGLFDVGAINRNAYAANPATAPKQGPVMVNGTQIGVQTKDGFFGGVGPTGPTTF